MKKAIVILVILALVVVGMLNKSGSSPQVASEMKTETTKGDIVELQGKTMFYKDKYGEYPVYTDNIYDNPESDVVWATMVFEKFFAKSKGGEDEARKYIEENVKLIDMVQMKSKGVTYELANKKSKYYLDLVTGMVLNPELIELGDEDYLSDLESNTGQYKPLLDTPMVVKDTITNEEMKPVHGSFKSGSNIYFYGGGDMVLAVRSETTREIKNVGEDLVNTGVTEILYVQTSTSKAAMIENGEVVIREIEIKR